MNGVHSPSITSDARPLKRCRSRFSNSLILLAASTANAEPADNLISSLQWNAARKDHDSTVV
jgi:hypothetical protein